MLERHRGGGGGGRHHGGGGGHHGHHHHRGGGGGRRWRGGGGGYWPGYAYDNYVMPFQCPAVYAPVIGTDGRLYDNACYANASGVAVSHRLPPGSQQLYGASLGEVSQGTKTVVAVGGFGLAALGLFLLARHDEATRHKKGRRQGRPRRSKC